MEEKSGVYIYMRGDQFSTSTNKRTNKQTLV